MRILYIELSLINVEIRDEPTLPVAYSLSGAIIGENVDIVISEGDVLSFQLKVGSSHPFWIRTMPGMGTDNPVATGISGVEQGAVHGLLIWNTTGIEEGRYYYECQNYANMGGLIRVVPTITGTLCSQIQILDTICIHFYCW